MSPVTWADKIKVKWPRNTSRAKDNYEEFVKLVDVNPMALAADKNDLRIARLDEVAKIWPEIMRKIPKARWDDMIKEIGVDAFGKNVPIKAFKAEDFAVKFFAKYEPERKKVLALPDKTIEQRDKRMAENLKALRAQKGIWR